MQQFGSVADLAKAVGVSDNAIYKWVSGRGQPGMSSLVNLAKAAGVSVEWLATGLGPSKVSQEPRESDEPEGFSGTRFGRLTLPGSSSLLESPQVVNLLRFEPHWFQRQFGLEPAHAALVEVRDHSMTPTIDVGDLCLVNITTPLFKYDGLYVLRSDNELTIKRLQREPDKALLILSDNPSYPPIRAANVNVAILGPVIWICGKP
jgi:phage repressor protein C with HTH and peptisase S24 domain